MRHFSTPRFWRNPEVKKNIMKETMKIGRDIRDHLAEEYAKNSDFRKQVADMFPNKYDPQHTYRGGRKSPRRKSQRRHGRTPRKTSRSRKSPRRKSPRRRR
jgi:hypothetical protein